MATPSKPTLVYFGAFPRGRSFPVHMALRLAGIDFDYQTVDPADWPAMKESGVAPFGHMPILKLPSGDVLAETIALAYYVGSKGNLMYGDVLKDTKVLQVVLVADEVLLMIKPSLREKDQEKKKQMRKELVEETLPPQLKVIENHLAKNKDHGFAVGDKMTIADIWILFFVQMLESGFVEHIPSTTFDAYPNISRVAAKVKDHPKVAPFFAELEK